MKRRIVEILREIEVMENIKIVYACESGSRAWGFESDDSDYDIRFIYVRPISHYFSINLIRDVIDRNKGNVNTSKFIRGLEDEELDFVGFDISKALKLISEGNPALAEWIHSPIVYMEKPFIIPAIQRLAERFFKTKAGIYHYEHMARKNFNQYIQNVDGDVIIKKYLYVLRPLYACEWIMRHELFPHGDIPPMEFDKIIKYVGTLKLAGFADIENIVKDLISQKKNGDELGRGPRIKTLDTFCEINLDIYENYVNTLGVEKLTGGDYKHIDQMFFEIVCK